MWQSINENMGEAELHNEPVVKETSKEFYGEIEKVFGLKVTEFPTSYDVGKPNTSREKFDRLVEAGLKYYQAMWTLAARPGEYELQPGFERARTAYERVLASLRKGRKTEEFATVISDCANRALVTAEATRGNLLNIDPISAVFSPLDYLTKRQNIEWAYSEVVKNIGDTSRALSGEYMNTPTTTKETLSPKTIAPQVPLSTTTPMTIPQPA